MTRLTYELIEDIPRTLETYDRYLMDTIGIDLRGLASRSTGFEGAVDARVGIIPITSGEGVIPGFSEAVKAILCHLGADACILREDVKGFVDALKIDADVVFCADDDLFAAVNMKTRKVVDNMDSTALGYLNALEAASSGLSGVSVLVIGVGELGTRIVRLLKDKGCKVLIYDIDGEQLRKVASSLDVRLVDGVEKGLEQSGLVVDTTPSADVIDEGHLSRISVLSAPGVPLCLTTRARRMSSTAKVIHDPLQIGVAVMLFDALG